MEELRNQTIVISVLIAVQELTESIRLYHIINVVESNRAHKTMRQLPQNKQTENIQTMLSANEYLPREEWSHTKLLWANLAQFNKRVIFVFRDMFSSTSFSGLGQTLNIHLK